MTGTRWYLRIDGALDLRDVGGLPCRDAPHAAAAALRRTYQDYLDGASTVAADGASVRAAGRCSRHVHRHAAPAVSPAP